MYVNISGYYYASYDAIKELMNTEIATLDPGATPLPWAMFFGWDPELIPNMPTLSADFLDGFSTTFPVAVVGQSGHVAWVNHKAFEVGTTGHFQSSSQPRFQCEAKCRTFNMRISIIYV